MQLKWQKLAKREQRGNKSLEGRLPRREHRLLPDDSAAADRLEEAVRREDLPVALAQLHRLLAEVLHQDAIPPLTELKQGYFLE